MPTVPVPDLVGLRVELARAIGHEAGVIVTGPDLDGPPLGALTWPGVWTVTAQWPEPGVEVPRRARVVIEFEQRGDGSGDRAPLLPRPDPIALQAAREPES